jgi:hypothetical protein
VPKCNIKKQCLTPSKAKSMLIEFHEGLVNEHFNVNMIVNEVMIVDY